MAPTTALRGWLARVRALEPEDICPRRGSICRGAAVNQLPDWRDSLEVGQWSEADAGTRAKPVGA
jgi:hypothetical protein